MFQGRNKSRQSVTKRTRQIETLESRKLMTTAMGVDSSFDGLYEIDLDNGAVSEIGKLHPDADRYTTPVSMAIRPGDNQIFVINNSPSEDAGLSTVDRATGRATRVGDTLASSISFDGGRQLYGIADGQLVRVNADDGATTTIDGADSMPRLFGLDYNSHDGNFYGVTGNTDGETWILKISPTGKALARVRLGEDIGSVPGALTIDNGVAVVSNIQRTLFKVDLDNGNILEKVDTEKLPQGLDIPTRVIRTGPTLAVDSSTDALYKIDLDTGVTNKIGPLHPAADRYTTPVSMAIRPSDNGVFVINNSPDQDAGLSIVNSSTGRATKIGDTRAHSITFDNRDNLFGIVDGKLAKIDASSGETKVLERSDELPQLYGLDFNPEDGNFYGVSGRTTGDAILLKISPAGELLDKMELTENIGTVPGAITIDNGVGVVSNISDVLFKVNLDTGKVFDRIRAEESPQGLDIAPRPLSPPRPQGAVLGIDASTDSLYTIDLDTGVATKIGPLHPDSDRYTTPVSMAIRPSDDAVFVINNSPVGDGGLSTLDTSTGRATLVGNTRADSLAFDKFDNLYGVVGNKLAKVDPGSGETGDLGGDELPVLYGMDYNWDDGHLYGITGDTGGAATLLKISTGGVVVAEMPLDAKIGSVPGSLVFKPDGQLVVSNLKRQLFDLDHTTGKLTNERAAERLPQGLGVSSTIRPGQPAELIGDLDGDGKVSFADFLTLSGNFGTKVETRAEGDLNGDCWVGFDDFLMLSGNFGAEVPAPALADELFAAEELWGEEVDARDDLSNKLIVIDVLEELALGQLASI